VNQAVNRFPSIRSTRISPSHNRLGSWRSTTTANGSRFWAVVSCETRFSPMQASTIPLATLSAWVSRDSP
jgi:hypothetical protein